MLERQYIRPGGGARLPPGALLTLDRVFGMHFFTNGGGGSL